MDKPEQVALALADALLAGPCDPVIMMKNMRWVMGRKWPWIPALCKKIHRHTGDHFYHYSRHEVADMILADNGFDNAWFRSESPPVIRHYCLLPPVAPDRPVWLEMLNLPSLANSDELANYLNLPHGELAWFADQWRDSAPESTGLRHYRYRWLDKPTGGVRLLEMPKQRLRNIQRKILRQILDRVPPHAAAQAFRKRHSCLSHASLHTGKQVVLRLDLKDFFSSIPGSRIHSLFAKLGYPQSVAAILARLCTHRTPNTVLDEIMARQGAPWQVRHMLRSRHLPQGAPTSPALANLCAFRLDMRLHTLAASMQATYSRYADDLTFSGDEELARALQRFIIQAGAIAIEEGFSLNHKKTRIMRATGRQQVTGIVINRHCNIRRSEFDRMKAILTNCVRNGPATQNRDHHADFRVHLAGKLAHLHMINAARATKLQTIFEQINWPAKPE
ncbi:reverse transcriptase family protein [Undibacterium sp. TS12]|uniref:reverse transcriptase family protein n=1 Tax=Undibacterium sp. TS12 TaxID=2908202 RepID=UPI001F4D09C8|nr:reverse transcriptase family protein [Undibacterium sp. TS12]MCH8621185.1 reverse transcriptase family protein [Undibacterium sp. TS12]